VSAANDSAFVLLYSELAIANDSAFVLVLVSHFTIASMVLNNKGEFAAAAVHSLLDNA